jgi:hypothetical protein
MSIRDFHSKLSSPNHGNALFQALSQLRRLDVRILLSEETTLAGWNPWMDGNEHHRHVTAGA